MYITMHLTVINYSKLFFILNLLHFYYSTDITGIKTFNVFYLCCHFYVFGSF